MKVKDGQIIERHAIFIKGVKEMIFGVHGHIDMICAGTKTQTRRLNRGIYKVGRDYAVQQKRGLKAESDIRIVMDRIWKETNTMVFVSESGRKYTNASEICISKEDAWQEGEYTPSLYESDFRKAYSKWTGLFRWAFKFHVVETKQK